MNPSRNVSKAPFALYPPEMWPGAAKASPTWYDGPDGPGEGRPSAIAYFSPEYGITAQMPQYAGGLGILAGDHLKAASDLGVPIIGVGLLYGAGYFRQGIDATGRQEEEYPTFDPDAAPLAIVRESDGTPVDIALGLPSGQVLHARVWRGDVGRVPMLLLDADLEVNAPELRSLTARLYGVEGEERLRQEYLLGVGGVRALRAFCRLTGTPAPVVFHTNEGHAGFLSVERLREHVEAGLTRDDAIAAVRAGTLFTTHTPVPAGIDRFPAALVGEYFATPEWAGIGSATVVALGAEPEGLGGSGVFNMACMGLRLAGRANGVSRLHGEVSREMFAPLWPGTPADKVPIGSVTNGVHAPTWVHPLMAGLGSASASEGWSGSAFWAAKRTMRGALVDDARARLVAAAAEAGHAVGDSAWIADALDPDVLTIGFARRVATYKRLTLMLRDPERLRTILLHHPAGRVQIVVAGKAHPRDEQGKDLLKEFLAFAEEPEVRHSVVFLPNYDMSMAATLFPGCDVWLNNPLRPYEACGTSGMKAALNGGLNLSIRDGWWDEWSDGENGWDIPSAPAAASEEERDDAEADALYGLLEDEVVPLFYRLDANGLPTGWIDRVRASLTTLGPKVQATRMVQEYTRELYVPAARAVAQAT